jgi:hypothetical protein
MFLLRVSADRQYPNILAYNIGNEVINLVSNTNAARMFHQIQTSDLSLTWIAYVKAAARDIKAYLKGINSGALVGYAAVDGEPAFRDTLADYLTCGDEDIVVDLYGEQHDPIHHAGANGQGLNNYEWCGDSSYNSSGWADIVRGFSEIPTASYMSEYG